MINPISQAARQRAREIAMGTARNLLRDARETFDLKSTHRAHEVEQACTLAVVWAAHLATLGDKISDFNFEVQVETVNHYIEQAARDLAILSECRFAGVEDR